MKKYSLLLLLSALVTFSASAQQDFILYNMYDVPQSIYSNPSNQFNGKIYVGLPALSSNYFSLSSSSLAYSDAIVPIGDSLLLDFNSLLSELEDENFFSFNTKIDLFSFGIHIGKRTQLTFNATENFNFRFNYTKDFAQFIYRGNGAFEDNTANFENIGLSFNHYREYGLGVSHQLNEKLRLGLRAKYLYGMANIYTKKTDMSLTTHPETFALTAKADIEIQTSGIDAYGDIDEEGTSNFLFGRDNSGLGLDLGAHYELNDKFDFNASIIDLGYINWNSFTKSYVVEDGQYSYSGIELDAFSGQTDTISRETSFDRIADSLEQAFELKEPTDAYTTPLTARIYIGANYRLNDQTILGGLIQNEIFRGNIRPSLTLSGHRKMTKWITLAASYTVINRSFNNLGLGFNINPGPVQLYIISDNVLGMIQPQDARHAHVRFGINLIFGSEKSKVLHPKFDADKPTKREFRKMEKEGKGKEITPPALEGSDSIPSVDEGDSIPQFEESDTIPPVEGGDSIPQVEESDTIPSVNDGNPSNENNESNSGNGTINSEDGMLGAPESGEDETAPNAEKTEVEKEVPITEEESPTEENKESDAGNVEMNSEKSSEQENETPAKEEKPSSDEQKGTAPNK